VKRILLHGGGQPEVARSIDESVFRQLQPGKPLLIIPLAKPQEQRAHYARKRQNSLRRYGWNECVIIEHADALPSNLE
jgi:hypothetical protein